MLARSIGTVNGVAVMKRIPGFRHLISGRQPTVMHNQNERTPLRIFAISGSLRSASSNSILVRAAAALAPDDVDVRIYTQLAAVPPFNPDDDGDQAPPAVASFRLEVAAADAILISSPEYAHGVPGALKNALDWIVGSGEIVGKPTALVNAAPRATHAQAALAETLRVMSATVVSAASIAIPLSGRALDVDGIVADPELSSLVRSSIAALAAAAASARRLIHS
jgi:NAD(P)H-dependent FMN reductase